MGLDYLRADLGAVEAHWGLLGSLGLEGASDTQQRESRIMSATVKSPHVHHMFI